MFASGETWFPRSTAGLMQLLQQCLFTDIATGGHGKAFNTSNSYPDLLEDNEAESKVTAFKHEIDQWVSHQGIKPAQYS